MASVIPFPNRHGAIVQIQICRRVESWECKITSRASRDAHVRSFASQVEAQAYAAGYCDSRGLELIQSDVAGAA